jgi:hypothetical protein
LEKKLFDGLALEAGVELRISRDEFLSVLLSPWKECLRAE